MFCKHNWKILSETRTDSIAERAIKIGMHFNHCPGDDLKQILVQIVTCDKCGKIKRYVSKV